MARTIRSWPGPDIDAGVGSFRERQAMIDHPDYSDLLLDHYRHPRNVGDLANADVVVTVGNPEHGDVMRLSLRIAAETVLEARFKVFGCAAAIAAGSMTTEMIRGRRLEEVGTITNTQVAEALGGLPESKIHCSVLAEQALKEALAHHRNQSLAREDRKKENEAAVPGTRG